nr:nucleotidyltransferase domain-containing protein [Chloroflexota bacterium]
MKEQIIAFTQTKPIQSFHRVWVKRISLFGSYARGQPDKDSDVHIFVKFEQPDRL